MHCLLFYEAGEDDVARRAEFRDAHLKLVGRGKIKYKPRLNFQSKLLLRLR